MGITRTTPYCSGALVYVLVQNNNSVSRSLELATRANRQSRNFYYELAPGKQIHVPFYGIYGNYQVDLNIWYPATNIYLHDETQYGINICGLHFSATCNSAAGTVDVTLQNVGTSFMTTRTERLQPLREAKWDDTPPGYGSGSVPRTVPVRARGATPVNYAINVFVVGSAFPNKVYLGTC